MSLVHLVPSEWRKVSLSSIAEVRGGLAKGRSGLRDPISVPYLRVANVQDGYFDLNEVKYIEVEANDVDKYSLMEGDVLFTEGGDADKLGRGFVWESQIRPCLHQNHVFSVRVNKSKIDPYFLAYQAASAHGRSYFLSCSKQTTNLASINSTQLKEFPVILPPISDQKRLAAVFKICDRAINSAIRLEFAYRRRLRGLMQLLLTGKQRFPGFREKWKVVNLRTVLKKSLRPIQKPNSAYTALSIKSHCKGTYTRLVEKPESVAMDTLYRVEKNDLIINITFAWEGAIAVVPKEHAGALVSHRFPTFLADTDLLVIEYLEFLVTSPWFIHHLGTISPGGAGRNRVLNVNDFLDTEIRIPQKEEQIRISNLLRLQAHIISLLDCQIHAYREQKKYLLKQLLSGQLHLPTQSA